MGFWELTIIWGDHLEFIPRGEEDSGTKVLGFVVLPWKRRSSSRSVFGGHHHIQRDSKVIRVFVSSVQLVQVISGRNLTQMTHSQVRDWRQNLSPKQNRADLVNFTDLQSCCTNPVWNWTWNIFMDVICEFINNGNNTIKTHPIGTQYHEMESLSDLSLDFPTKCWPGMVHHNGHIATQWCVHRNGSHFLVTFKSPATHTRYHNEQCLAQSQPGVLKPTSSSHTLGRW